MKKLIKIMFTVSLALVSLYSTAQVTIDFNSDSDFPHLILKETGDDFARLFFENVNSPLGENWSINGKVSTVDSDSRFRIFYDGLSTSGSPLVLTGDMRLGIGTSNPAARLTLRQGLDQDDMGFRIINAGATGSGRMWMDGDDFHVHAGTSSNNGLTLKSDGRIGAFTDSPEAKFAIYESNHNATEDLFLVSRMKAIDNIVYSLRILEAKEDGNVFIRKLGVQEDNPTHQLDVNTTDADVHPFRVQVQGETKLRMLNNGGTSIGSGNPTPPANGLHVTGQLHVGTTSAGTDKLQVKAETGENPLKVVINTSTKLRVRSNGGTSIGTDSEDTPGNGLFVEGNVLVGDGSDITLHDEDGNASIILKADVSGKGRIKTDELEITGGSDISEKFCVRPGKNIEPGTLVSIDVEHPGQLCITQHMYDTRIAGVISGANGISTGLIMGQTGSIADGEYPIALTGRVYVKAEAIRESIKPGDLLTSSSIPGHVMKATKKKQRSGAIIGKALSSIESGLGEVLMLISLQ